MDPRRPDKQQKYKPPPQNNNAAPGEDLTPDYMNILDTSRKRSFSKCSERFKVVKIESSEPFKRGRWKCMDFLDQSYDRIAHYNSVMYKTSDTNLNQSISSENWDIDNSSMLQIFQQQNIIMALDENRENVSLKTENYVCNGHGNYILLPGMVSSSLVGIKYPFELNFLPISSSEHNLGTDSSESELKSIHSQNSSYSFNQEYNSLNNESVSNYSNEDQVCEQITIICQNDNKQINLDSKMSTGKVHYITQNNEIQNSPENHIKNNQPINREVFNNCSNVNNVPPNLNVMPNMNHVGNNHGNIDPNIQQHKEIIDSSFKPAVMNPNNNIPTSVNSPVYQIYSNEVQPEYKNVNPNPQNINPNQDQFKNVSSPQQEYKNVSNLPEVKVCNVQNLTNQSYNNEQQNLPYQSSNPVEVKTQILNKPVNNQNICQNNLTVRTHTYDVMPDQNQNIYNNTHFNKSANNSNNHERTNTQEEMKYCPNLQQNYEIRNPICPNNNYSNDMQMQNINNHKTNARGQNGRQMYSINEQVTYQKNKTEYSYQKTEEKNLPNIKEDIPCYSRPMSAKCIQDDQKSKFSNYTSQQFSFIPEVVTENSQTSVNFPNANLSSMNTENGPIFLDQTQLFMPVYPIGQNPYMQNMYFPVYSNTVQFPLLNAQNPSLCENLSETNINRKPIGYQRICVPQGGSQNVIKRSNQFYYQQNQTKQPEPLNYESYSPPNNDTTTGSDFPGSSSLDVKIEALMDLVKKHIKFTIMEDIHSLKQKINLLKERVAQLEFENEMLKTNVEEYKKIKDKLSG